jgi:crotonobetainyl-CoA:carnitine CoA-transferase CaiB-like acyl-CoA transferase
MTAAIHHARATGEGTWIDVSCWDAAVDATRQTIGTLLAAPEQRREGKPPLYDIYVASDGGLVLFCAIEQKFWQRFCDAVDRPDLAATWSGVSVDFTRNAELRAALEAVFATRPVDAWVQLFDANDIPGCAVLDAADVTASAHFRARGRHGPGDGPLPFRLANPIRWHDRDERAGAAAGGAPVLGADTAAVFAEWTDNDHDEESKP